MGTDRHTDRQTHRQTTHTWGRIIVADGIYSVGDKKQQPKVVLEHGVGTEPKADAGCWGNDRLGVDLVGEDEFGLDRAIILFRLQMLEYV